MNVEADVEALTFYVELGLHIHCILQMQVWLNVSHFICINEHIDRKKLLSN